MRLPRCSGVLLHPTSLPGPDGIGDLGPESTLLLEFMASAGQHVLQVLPLGPTGYGDSPYQSFSTFAGNPLLVSPTLLRDQGLLSAGDLLARPEFPEDRVDFGRVIEWKRTVIRRVWETFVHDAANPDRQAYAAFCEQHAHWLNDYALFMALKDRHGGIQWTAWDRPYAMRDPDALAQARDDMDDAIAALKFGQFLFFRQWDRFRAEARGRGIRIVGDIPIYVAHDSADVWAHRELFHLDAEGNPTVVAGVPPDYFSKTGQLWGNPIYRWDHAAETGYAWWVERLRATLGLVDVVRLDHFRGFESYWEVPAGEATAVNGRWVPGPKDWIFDTFKFVYGPDLPIIAENLGVITEDVEALRRRFDLPGMAVFQFGYGPDATLSPLPAHAFCYRLVAYSGTHDNDTLMGWWSSLDADASGRLTKQYIARYLDLRDTDEFNWAVIRALMASVADVVILPVQDLLGLGSEGRMNFPGRTHGNWAWRLAAGALTPRLSERLGELAVLYGRCGPSSAETGAKTSLPVIPPA